MLILIIQRTSHTHVPPAAWDKDCFAWALDELYRLGQWEVRLLSPRVDIGEPAAPTEYCLL